MTGHHRTAPACRTCFSKATHATPGQQLGALSMRPSHWCQSHAPEGAIPLSSLRAPITWM